MMRRRAIAKLRARKKAVVSKSQTKQSGRRKCQSASTLLQEVEQCIDIFDYTRAEKLCRRALRLYPTNVAALETAASVLLEVGKSSEAFELFQQSVELNPDVGHTQYMYLGQMSSGNEAVKYLEKGIQLMINGLHTASDGSPVTNTDISSACCALAEVYLTDSCFADNADSECHRYCQKAIEYGPKNPEAYQVMASYLISKDRKKEAHSTLLQSTSLWMNDSGGSDSENMESQKEREEDLEAEKEEEDDMSASACNVAAIPPFYTRLNCAKLLIEVEEYKNAQSVLEGLLRDDDEVLAVWYLLGWLCYIIKDYYNAKTHLEKVTTMFTKLGCDDDQMLEHTQELLHEIVMEEFKEIGKTDEKKQDDSDYAMDV